MKLSDFLSGLFGFFIAGCVAYVTTIMLASSGVNKMWAGSVGGMMFGLVVCFLDAGGTRGSR